jgi:hypothetical protein
VVTKLANKMAAMGARSVIVNLFSRPPSDHCSKTMKAMVLATVAIPSVVSDARSLSEAPETL